MYNEPMYNEKPENLKNPPKKHSEAAEAEEHTPVSATAKARHAAKESEDSESEQEPH